MLTAHDLPRFGRRMFFLLVSGWAAILVLEALQRSRVISALVESSLRLAIWSLLVSLLVLLTWRSFPWRAVRIAFVLFAVITVVGFAVGVTEDIRVLDNVPLVGHRGALTSLFKKLIFACWTCTIGYLFYFLLNAVHEGQQELEGRVAQRTTELQQANEQAWELRNQLAHVNRVASMGQMASALAHEINQPLGVITNLANASRHEARHGMFTLDRARATVEDMRQQALRASEIIRRVRSFLSRQEAHLSTIDINEVVTEVIRLLKPDARQYRTEIRLDLAAGLPPLQADRVHIQQVLVNVLRNAFEALQDAATAAREVTVQSSLAATHVRVEVSHGGIAVDSKIVQRMFEPYFTTKRNGLGMGLSISRSIIEHHGGQLAATANPDGGVRVHFVLPLTGEDEHDAGDTDGLRR